MQNQPMRTLHDFLMLRKTLELIMRHKNMGCFNLRFVFFIIMFCLSNSLITIQCTTAKPNYVYHVCLGDNNTPNSTFQSNLKILLPSLSSANPSIIKNRFYNTTVGRSLDIVYGSFSVEVIFH